MNAIDSFLLQNIINDSEAISTNKPKVCPICGWTYSHERKDEMSLCSCGYINLIEAAEYPEEVIYRNNGDADIEGAYEHPEITEFELEYLTLS
jgi:hypothetical protein